MARITGESVSLKTLTQSGTDDFNQPVYTEKWITINNVLVSVPTSDEIASNLTTYGARIRYTLCIPKGDTHDWFDTEVQLANRGTFHTVGDVIEYTEANIPYALDWNRKVNLERIEG